MDLKETTTKKKCHNLIDSFLFKIYKIILKSFISKLIFLIKYKLSSFNFLSFDSIDNKI